MSRNRLIILGFRVLLFAVLGVLFIVKGMGMEILHTKLLFIGIGVADFVYAFFLARPLLATREDAGKNTPE